ncbi:VWA domain-containing protein [Marixanthomonas sp. SCSIO 43207]|uniref:vWA domain-containing protein n=1 Tax=Marixanthomonas sp. SCSIO 43207 TaxID=2779360 RepID=UPI001CA95A90|nr:VWA domain-containing protein [Marixanthomonas sp. SCSIO 43207]UAB80448.1 VWA domain-containing protein [Marixanthomonas sp. SCSIO 43207]
MKQLAALFCVFLLSFQLNAQSNNPAPIIFVYDASGSMWGQMQGKTKMEIASSVLSTTVDNLPTNQQIGLVAYGHRQKGDCKDVETLVGISNSSKNTITTAVKNIKPLGKTPLAYSATTVINQLRKSKEKATIILITDGIESCNGNICDVVKAAKEEGIDFKLHIVGFGLKAEETGQLKCAATAGDGTYYDAADANALGDAMNQVVTQTIDKNEGNHGIYAVKNNQAVDALMTAYKPGTSERMGGIRTYRDTAYAYLPAGTYDIEVRPLENSKIKPLLFKNVTTYDDKKTFQLVSFDGGKFVITTTNNGEGWDCTTKITDQNGTVVGGIRTYGKTRPVELNAGTYDIKVQALNMQGLETTTIIEDKVIEPGKETPVRYNFESGVLEILPKYNGELIDCTSYVEDTATGKRVAGGRTYNKGRKININPGTYKVQTNALGKNSNLGKKTVTVTIKAGETHSETINY